MTLTEVVFNSHTFLLAQEEDPGRLRDEVLAAVDGPATYVRFRTARGHQVEILVTASTCFYVETTQIAEPDFDMFLEDESIDSLDFEL